MELLKNIRVFGLINDLIQMSRDLKEAGQIAKEINSQTKPNGEVKEGDNDGQDFNRRAKGEVRA